MSFTVSMISTSSYSNSANNDVEYAYDFTNMEEGQYEVSFTYRGGQNHLDSTDLALVYVDWGTGSTATRANGSVSAQRTQFMGFLHNQYNTNTDGYLFANLNDNPNVFLNSKINGNIIRVRLLTIAGVPFTTHALQNPADYVFTLQFRKI